MTARLNHTIAFRVTDEEMMRLESLRSSFADQRWRTVFEWLLGRPEVQSVCSARLSGVVPAVEVVDPVADHLADDGVALEA